AFAGKYQTRAAISDFGPWAVVPRWEARPYLSAVWMVVKVVFIFVPRPVRTGMMATAMPAAIRPYSMAVAACSSPPNLTICRIDDALHKYRVTSIGKGLIEDLRIFAPISDHSTRRIGELRENLLPANNLRRRQIVRMP